MKKVISANDLKELFTKPFGLETPSKQKWAEYYNENPGSYAIAYSTDMIDSYVDNIIELLKKLKAN